MFGRSKTVDALNDDAIAAAISRSQAVIEFRLDGTIITANENFLKAMGYSLDEIKDKHHSMFVASGERDSAAYREFWASLNRGEFQVAEYKRIAKGGREVWIQASYNPILDRSGKPVGVMKFATDITAQKIRSMKDAGQIAAIGRSQAVIAFNLDGTISTANENFLNAMGYSLSRDPGQASQHVRGAGRARAARPIASSGPSSTAADYVSGEFKRIAKGGREIWILASYNPIVDESGKPFGVVKFATDITDQKLKAADTSGQIAAIGKSQAVIEFNMDGTIVTANENFLGAMGYALAEIQGKHHSMFVDPAERASAGYREFWARLNRGEYQAGEYRRLGRGGKEVWIQASYNPILDLNGKPFKVVKYACDTTEKARTRMAAERARSLIESVAAGSEEMSASIREISETMVKSKADRDQGGQPDGVGQCARRTA